LYQVLGSTSIGAAPIGPTRVAKSSPARAATSDAAVLVALATVCGSEPSTMSCRRAVRPRAMSDA
jgi:hypothetical protein